MTGGRGSSQRPGPRETRRNLRSRLACARCQRRKIRCDGNVPTCNNCQKASVECIDGESVRLGSRDLPRAQISRFRQRIHWLESVIKERCPDVDLAHGPAVDPCAGANPDNTPTVDLEAEKDPAGLVDSQPFLSSPPPHSGHTRQQLNQQPLEPRPQEHHQQSGQQSHEIGLVSLNGSQDPRYIGPSSGYFLARVMLASVRQDDSWRTKTLSAGQPLSHDLVEALQGPLPLPPENQAKILCDEYFQVVHTQYPILHRPTFMAKLSQLLCAPGSEPEPEDAFQVFMVLAIGSIIASNRRRVRLPGESYCLSALRYLDSLNVENSLRGLQCLLLLFIFTIHCSSMKLNVWYLNYQCIASVLDLGLQRNITTKSGITLVEQEMRTRIFWVVIMLDRRVATMMGRPIGLRDEACDLRLPQDLEDDTLISDGGPIHPSLSDTSGSMSFSIQLFKLAKLNSEIKYVANSIVRDTPGYAYPTVIDYHDWQKNMLARLNDWAARMPLEDTSNTYIHTVCRIQYQSLKMVLLRPSPAIPNPSRESLRQCHDAARENLGLFSQLYKNNLLIHSWDTFYSLVLSAITRLYCIKTVPDLARSTDAEMLLADLGDCLSILSATGEHWPGAKRCRDILDDLGRTLVRWLKEGVSTRPERHSERTGFLPMAGDASGNASSFPGGDGSWGDSNGQALGSGPGSGHSMMPEGGLDLPLFGDPFEQFPAAWNGIPESENMDAIIRSLFDDFIPDTGE